MMKKLKKNFKCIDDDITPKHLKLKVFENLEQ